MKNFAHIPVLVKEVANILRPQKGKVFVDGTIGLGGHARELARRGASIIALDCDKEAISMAQENLKDFKNINFIQANFADIDKVLGDLGIKKVDGVLLDLGVSSMQLEDKKRGFSFEGDWSLDMRMDQSQDLTAEKIVNKYSEGDLIRIFTDFGEERFAKKIAQKIVEWRPIKTTGELVEIIKKSMPPKYRYGKKTHFATNIFRALRMEVNSEVKNLSEFLGKAGKYIKSGGKIVIISFHSIEDRIVKRGFRMLKSKGEGTILFTKPIMPTDAEIKQNPRARSAKLRAFEIC